jgi:hypothetical protein
MPCDVLLRARTLCLVGPVVVSLVLLPLRRTFSPFTSSWLRNLSMRCQPDLISVSSVIFLLWCGLADTKCRQEDCSVECACALRRGYGVSNCAIERVPAGVACRQGVVLLFSLFCWVVDALVAGTARRFASLRWLSPQG